MTSNFSLLRKAFIEKGYYVTAHPVVQYHLRKDFTMFDVINEQYFILPVGRDFIHVALIEHEYGVGNTAIQVRYTCAGDDLLYGLRIKFNSGGSKNYEDDVADLEAIVEAGNLKNHPRYVRKRFRHGRTQAKVRAALTMMVEKWRSFVSSFKLKQG